MPKALLYQKGVRAHVDKQGGMGVPYIVHPNDLHAGALAAAL